MKQRLLKLWAYIKLPFVFAAMVLTALIVVIADARRGGRRAEKLQQLKRDKKEELDEVEEMAARGDSAGLKSDILRRVRGKSLRD